LIADPAARIAAGMVLDILPAHLSDPAVRELVAYHQRDMLAMSPPGTSFALDESGLSGPGITLLGAWRGRVLVGIGAMKRLSADSAEVKSMRTHADHLGRGVASAVLDRLIAIARAEGISRLSLETGTNERFAPAVALYAKRGFFAGEAFADYANGPHNQCYHLALAPAAP